MTEAHPQVRKHRGLILSPLIYNIRGFSPYISLKGQHLYLADSAKLTLKTD